MIAARGASVQAIAWCAVAVLLAATAGRVVGATWQEWNDARLAPAAALLAGHPLYVPLGDGPLLGHVYGPVSALLYTGPVIVGRTPAVAVMLGSLLSLLLYLAPLAATLRADPAIGSRTAALALQLFWLYPFTTAVLEGPAFNVHADAPALGLTLLACGLLYTPRDRAATWRLWGGAATLVLAAGAKQVVVAAALGVLAYVWLADGRRAATRLVAALAIMGAVGLAFAAVLFDLPAMWLDTVVIPSRHPWQGDGRWPAIERGIRDLVPRCVPAVAVLVVAGLAQLGGRRPAAGWRAWVAANGWLMPAFVAVACVPTSLLGRAKFGGSLNTLAFTLYFLVAAAVTVLARVASPRDGEASPPAPHSDAAAAFSGVATRALAGALLVTCVAVLAAWVGVREVPAAVTALRELPSNPESAAYRAARHHPGRIYFPFRPLVSILAGDGPHPFSDAVYARELAGFDVSEAEFRRHLPREMRYVAIHREYPDHSRRFLRECRTPASLPELADGWTVHECTGLPGRSEPRE